MMYVQRKVAQYSSESVLKRKKGVFLLISNLEFQVSILPRITLTEKSPRYVAL